METAAAVQKSQVWHSGRVIFAYCASAYVRGVRTDGQIAEWDQFSCLGGAALIFELELISVKEASWQDWLTPNVRSLPSPPHRWSLLADPEVHDGLGAADHNRSGSSPASSSSSCTRSSVAAAVGEAHQKPNSSARSSSRRISSKRGWSAWLPASSTRCFAPATETPTHCPTLRATAITVRSHGQDICPDTAYYGMLPVAFSTRNTQPRLRTEPLRFPIQSTQKCPAIYLTKPVPCRGPLCQRLPDRQEVRFQLRPWLPDHLCAQPGGWVSRRLSLTAARPSAATSQRHSYLSLVSLTHRLRAPGGAGDRGLDGGDAADG